MAVGSPGQQSGERSRVAGFGVASIPWVAEALDLGRGLPRGGKPELVGGIVFGVLLMVPLAFV